MNKRRKQNATQIRAEMVEIYRDYPAVNITGSIVALEAFLSHRSFFQALGDKSMASEAERAWLADAVILAGEPASSKDEAVGKIAALQPAIDGRVWETASEGHLAVAAMITVGVEAERSRWELQAATRH